MTTETQVEQKAEEKPKLEETAEFKTALNSAVSKATSRYQQQASEARKEAKTLGKQVQDLSTQFAQATRDAEVARLAGDDEEAGARVREQINLRDEITKKIRELEEREEKVTTLEKRTSMKLLSEEYGIPSADLEEYDNPKDMELAALRFQRDQLLKRKNGNKEEMKTSKPVDTAEGRITRGKVPDPIKDPKGFAEFYAKLKESPTFRRQ